MSDEQEYDLEECREGLRCGAHLVRLKIQAIREQLLPDQPAWEFGISVLTNAARMLEEASCVQPGQDRMAPMGEA